MHFPGFGLALGRRKYAVVVVTIVMTLALASCGGSSNKATSTSAASQSTVAASTAAPTATSATTSSVATSTAAPTPTAAPTQAAATTAPTTAPTAAAVSGTGISLTAAGSALEQTVKAWDALKSYKMTMNIYDNGSSTPTTTGTLETELPDKSHWVIDSGGQHIEMIIVSGTTYVNVGGTWTQVPGGSIPGIPKISSSDIASALATPAASPNTAVSKGTDTVNGVKCDVYDVTESSGTSTVWIGQQDHLPYKIVFNDPTTSTKTEVDFSNYGDNFNIQPPM